MISPAKTRDSLAVSPGWLASIRDKPQLLQLPENVSSIQSPMISFDFPSSILNLES
jgi:hypothetical protein